jgi:hypothetical protein
VHWALVLHVSPDVQELPSLQLIPINVGCVHLPFRLQKSSVHWFPSSGHDIPNGWLVVTVHWPVPGSHVLNLHGFEFGGQDVGVPGAEQCPLESQVCGVHALLSVSHGPPGLIGLCARHWAVVGRDVQGVPAVQEH